ncbi:MAG: type III PLP-dependent enzyme [Steroidobacterales bacterium]
MIIDRFGSAEQLLRRKTTDTPVFCFYPERLRAAARQFVANFPGEVLYAIKANPHPDVLRWLVEGGIRAFDTASIAEMELARRILPGAHCSYNHPIKPRRAIVAAYHDHGIRDFVVDHPAELDKLFAEVGTDIVVQVRVAAPNPHATISFNSKFGANPAAALGLLRAVTRRGARAAVSTHIGYQTTDPDAFVQALQLLAGLVATAGIRPEYVNLGGGFPSVLMPEGVVLGDFFEAIRTARARLPQIADVPLRCEPGSALAHTGGGVLTQVVLVKEDAIFLNDGVYGALAELIHSRIQPPTRVLTPAGLGRVGVPRNYTVFGPTCDSFDVIPVPFTLPATISEGDWLDLSMMGAYSNVLITDFNGLGEHEYAILGEDD